jgi:hypothetical protein
MKISYYRPRGYTSHFTYQTNNPFKIIMIIKHLKFSYSNFFLENLIFHKSEFLKSETKQRLTDEHRTLKCVWCLKYVV